MLAGVLNPEIANSETRRVPEPTPEPVPRTPPKKGNKTFSRNAGLKPDFTRFAICTCTCRDSYRVIDGDRGFL